MFPPEESVAKRLHLDRCIRVLPHHQDTGGFFITLIRKLPIVNHIDLDKEYLCVRCRLGQGVSDAKATGQINPPEADATRTMKAPPAKKLKHVYEENPFQFMDLSSQFLQQDWPKVKKKWGLIR
ncbi:Mitogen-activated kinase kinase kinase 15 [Brachionus plicatilis]|uniref:Mitogen-activated kinase kinase kinase 15 n=1 Tax=Brachionus plicatilis TaxID=10195 RepID=A0A3M7Q0B4_BRAPC|nr:Mitogen-activated kinase kinase kinase 15 [Brachionus plicatilis]